MSAPNSSNESSRITRERMSLVQDGQNVTVHISLENGVGTMPPTVPRPVIPVAGPSNQASVERDISSENNRMNRSFHDQDVRLSSGILESVFSLVNYTALAEYQRLMAALEYFPCTNLMQSCVVPVPTQQGNLRMYMQIMNHQSDRPKNHLSIQAQISYKLKDPRLWFDNGFNGLWFEEDSLSDSDDNEPSEISGFMRGRDTFSEGEGVQSELATASPRRQLREELFQLLQELYRHHIQCYHGRTASTMNPEKASTLNSLPDQRHSPTLNTQLADLRLSEPPASDGSRPPPLPNDGNGDSEASIHAAYLMLRETLENYLSAFERHQAQVMTQFRERSVPSAGLDQSIKDAKSTVVQVSPREANRDGTRTLQDQQCCICLRGFCTGERVRILHICHHSFHVGCIEPWFERDTTCPMCRNNLKPHKDQPPDS